MLVKKCSVMRVMSVFCQYYIRVHKTSVHTHNTTTSIDITWRERCTILRLSSVTVLIEWHCCYSETYSETRFWIVGYITDSLINPRLLVTNTYIILLVSPFLKGEDYCFCHYSFFFFFLSSFFLHARFCPGHISETARSFPTKFWT